MSEVVIFQEITTDSILNALEDSSKKYENLYVDMSKPEQRKYVKGQASDINALLKKLDRARIDKTKEFKVDIDAEAKLIDGRLRAANAPFTSLIDGYNAERAEILEAEKAALQLVEDAKQKEEDHESAIMMDKVRTFEAAEVVRLQEDRDKQIVIEAAEQANLDAAEAIKKAEAVAYHAGLAAEEAVMNAERDAIAAHEKAEQEKQAAIQAEQQRQADEKQREADELEAREADVDHKRYTNNAAKDSFIEGGFTEDQAILAVKLIVSNRIQQVTINY